MTEFGRILLLKFGELNRPVTRSELLRHNFNEIELDNGISELISIEYIRERPVLTYNLTYLGRRHLLRSLSSPSQNIKKTNGIIIKQSLKKFGLWLISNIGKIAVALFIAYLVYRFGWN